MIAGLSMVELSLLFFLVLFLGIVVRLVFSRSTRWKDDARIPLRDTLQADETRDTMSRNAITEKAISEGARQ